MIRARQGFSLLELVIALVIIALVVGFGVNMGQNAVNSTGRLAMLEKMALIKQSIDNYAARNGYLPCPADPQLLPSNIAFGFESRGAAPGSDCLASGGMVGAGGVWHGMLPVQNLGLDESYAIDQWGNKITYAMSANHRGISTLNAGFGSYARQNGTLIINAGLTASPVTLTNINGVPGAGATYVVISHGKNARGAFPLNAAAVAVACAGGFIDSQNCDRADNIFYDSDYNEGAQATTQFDDYVVWGTNATARDPLVVLPNSCPVGVCETWCAPCETGGSSTAPATPTRLCAKFITRNLPSCEARCIWPTDTSPCP